MELLHLFFLNETVSTYKGISLSDLARIEAHYGITIRVLLLIPKKDKTKYIKGDHLALSNACEDRSWKWRSVHE